MLVKQKTQVQRAAPAPVRDHTPEKIREVVTTVERIVEVEKIVEVERIVYKEVPVPVDKVCGRGGGGALQRGRHV